MVLVTYRAWTRNSSAQTLSSEKAIRSLWRRHANFRPRAIKIGAKQTVRESSHPSRRSRHPHLRRDNPPPQAYGRDRWPPHPLAHPQDLRPARHQRLHHLLRIQGLHHQGILRQLLPPHLRRHLRHARQQDDRPPVCRRTLARHPRRHRGIHRHRRPPPPHRANTSTPPNPSA